MVRWSRLSRLIGLILFIVLLVRLDIRTLFVSLRNVNAYLLLAAILLNVPMLLIKVVRWLITLIAQGINWSVSDATLAYTASMYLGLVTPARAGELVKALYISQDCNVTIGRALSSVLADRLFDLYALLMVGGIALLSLGVWRDDTSVLGLALLPLLLTLPLVMFLHEGVFDRIQALGPHLGRPGQWLFAPQGWLLELRNGLRQLSLLWLLAAVGLTTLAYVIFFGQCYLLALALGLKISFVQVSFAVALGSLVTLLPISISGLGTREAAIVAYLGTAGVSAEMALGFSLLVFVTFYIAGGLMGAVAWWIKPAPAQWKRSVVTTELGNDI
jgi:uncharacterized protein (TIRG00374 family)